MRTITVNSESPMRKMIIAMVGLGVLAIFLTSFVMGVEVPAAKEHASARSTNSELMSSTLPLMAKLKDNPNDYDALVQLANAFYDAEKWENAEPLWGKIAAKNPTCILSRYRQGFALVQLNRFPEAIPVYEAILKLKPEEAAAHYYLGMINKHGLKRLDVAKKHFKLALALKPDDKELFAEIEKELAAIK